MDTHKHLELERINEKFTYLDNLLRSNDINILKYFSFPKSPESNVVEYFSFPKSPKSNAFNKYHIKNELESDLSKLKLDFNLLKKYFLNYFENLWKEIKHKDDDDEYQIDIYSPFFEIISKTKLFELKFTIFLNGEIIDENKLENDYISCFRKLNDYNIKYSSLTLFFIRPEHLNYLNNLNIDLKKIKRLNIKQGYFRKSKINKNIKLFFKNFVLYLWFVK